MSTSKKSERPQSAATSSPPPSSQNRPKRSQRKKRDDFQWGFVSGEEEVAEKTAESRDTGKVSRDFWRTPLPPKSRSDEPIRLHEDEITSLVVTPTAVTSKTSRKWAHQESHDKKRDEKKLSEKPHKKVAVESTESSRAENHRTAQKPPTKHHKESESSSAVRSEPNAKSAAHSEPKRDDAKRSDVKNRGVKNNNAKNSPDLLPDSSTDDALVIPSYGRSHIVRDAQVAEKTAPPKTSAQHITHIDAREKRAGESPKKEPLQHKSPAPEKTAPEKIKVSHPAEKYPAEKATKPVSEKRLALPDGVIPKGITRPPMVWDAQKREYVPKVVEQFAEKSLAAATKPTPAPSNLARTESARKELPPVKVHKEEKFAAVEKPLVKPERIEKPERVLHPKTPPRERHSAAEKHSVSEKPEKHHPAEKPVAKSPEKVSSRHPSGFAALGLSPKMLASLKTIHYFEPTPIQSGVYATITAKRDLMGQARTGTGKTAAFLIPLIEMIGDTSPAVKNSSLGNPAAQRGGDIALGEASRPTRLGCGEKSRAPQAMILVPTRELAMQVCDEAARLCSGRDIDSAACYGGKPIASQITLLRRGVDIIVGTPGRVLDLMARRVLEVSQIKWIVLDEADRMLDIGFRPDIEKILRQVPRERQTLLFSATMPPDVVRLAERYMREPEVLDFSAKELAVETIEQFYITIAQEQKLDALLALLKEQQPNQAIVFCRTKRGADKVARQLGKKLASVEVIHGDLAQSMRDRVMGKFRSGAIKILVATDVVGRGIDVSGISHIINYDIPAYCDDYVHRVGRTGRMGREGIAFTFVTIQEGAELTRIEMRINKLLKRVELAGFAQINFSNNFSNNAESGEETSASKPVYGKPVRKVKRSL